MNITARFLQLDNTSVILAPTDAGGYRLTGLTMPQRSRRRAVLTDPDVSGDVEQQSVLDAGTYQLSWLVMGSSTSQVASRTDTLIAAAETAGYLLEVTIDGVEETWQARAADVAIDLAPERLMNHHRPVIMTVPVQADPL